jgi:hypothetical protein
MTTRKFEYADMPQVDDDLDDLTELDTEMEIDDDEYLFDESDAEETEETEEYKDSIDRYRQFSARRRIEIASENRWLKSLMEDFDDYDSLENLSNNEFRGLSY